MHTPDRPAPLVFRRRTLMQPARWVIAALALTSTALLIALIVVLVSDEEAPEVGFGVTLDEVSDHPERFLQRRVIVSGEVGHVLSPHVFTLGDDQMLVASGSPLFGLADNGLPAAALEESIVQVDGRVSTFDIARLERELGIDLDPAVFEEQRSQPVIVARSVLVNPSEEQVAEAQPEPPTQIGGLAWPEVLSVADVRENFGQFEGEVITVAGDLGRTLGPHVVLLDGLLYGTQDVLIVTRGDPPEVPPQRIPVRVTGVLRRFEVAAIEHSVGVDLEVSGLIRMVGEPVIVADSIQFVIAQEHARMLLPAVLGEQVVLRGEVAEAPAPRAFTIEAGTVLVLLREDPAEPLDGATVVIEGMAVLFGLDEAEQITGVDLDALLDAGQWEGRPIVVAERVQPVPEPAGSASTRP